MTPDEMSEAARQATERANLAQERGQAISALTRWFAVLYTAYEGNESALNEIYEMRESFRQWAGDRRKKLQQIETDERVKAALLVERLTGN